MYTNILIPTDGLAGKAVEHGIACCCTDSSRDKNKARSAGETWGRGKIAPFRIEVPSAHFYSPTQAERLACTQRL
jgi:hypothetical protein